MRKLVALTAAALLASSCGLGEKSRQATVIHASRARAVEAKTASGTLRLELTLDPDVFATVTTIRPLPAAALTAIMDIPVGFDFASGRVQIGAPTSVLVGGSPEGEAGPQGLSAEVQEAVAAEAQARTTTTPAPPPGSAAAARSVFQGDVIYVRRQGLRPKERRQWAKLDFSGLPDDEQRPDPEELMYGARYLLSVANTINPAYLLDLVLGALPGSVERAGSELIDGVNTNKYEANISIERSTTELDLDDEEVATRQLMFRLVRLTGDVHPGQFWLDDEGRVRRIRIELEQQATRTVQNDVVITLDVPGYGKPIDAPLPGREEVVEIERYGRLVRVAAPTD